MKIDAKPRSQKCTSVELSKTSSQTHDSTSWQQATRRLITTHCHGVSISTQCHWYDRAKSIPSPHAHLLKHSGAAKVRPALPIRSLPSLTSIASSRHASTNVPVEDPKKKAQSIIDALPGNSLVSKTAILSSGAGLSIWAIANELYIVNEESIVMLATLSVFWAVGHYGGPMYREWADGQVNKQKGILNAARESHTQAVKDRIDNVKQLGGVIDITKQLFEVSRVGLKGSSAPGEGLWLTHCRKPHNSRLRLLSLSRRLQ